jgi:tRNA dimethylallyltransferase
MTSVSSSSGHAHPLVVIAGPTGSGKSELALRIAETFQGEIVNCDSLQLYRYFDIGTAKLPPDQRRGIPHHLIDILQPDEGFTAGDYARLARPLLTEIADRRRLPVVVGGTGFYLRALLDGLFAGPARDEALRATLLGRSERRPGFLHRLLRRLDPAAAARIHANDTNKLIRAIEVCLTEGRPLTSLFVERRPEPLTGFAVLKIGLDPGREALFRRLDTRTEAMFAAGLVDEVRGILALGYSPGVKPFESLGYRQALRVLAGEMETREAVSAAALETRRYAKRQLTWFRREPGLHWLQGFGSDPALQENTLELTGKFLASENK